MKIFTCNYKQVIKTVLCFFALLIVLPSDAQNDSTRFLKRLPGDSAKKTLNMDAIYNRPFLSAGKLPVAIGGYLEANTQYAVTNGVSDGFSFQFRRMTLFLSSTIARKIRFLSEIEFEDGTKEINIEFAALDIELHPLLVLRGGIVMNPIGAFNQNHDGPRWDFIDRPISATTILPATLSNAGFGIHGKYFLHNWVFGYETYLTNGFDDNIISNSQNRTSLAAGKSNPEKFEESNSGLPMFTGKFAVRHRKVGELGLSYMTGVYNKFEQDGFRLDNKRKATAMAVDFNTSLLKNRIVITGEFVKVIVEVPQTYSQLFGTQQLGGFVDLVGTLVQRKMFGWDKARLNIGCRFEYVDYNLDNFKETNQPIGDELWSIVPTVAFRPVGSTVIRFNYRFLQQRDLFGNPPSNTGVIQFGFSSYF
ncbi:MAG TPA: hypothetical protein PL029_02465 [Bacteroidia bacterium]|nr:hypothetical protein [Bacteroidia bacterium]